MNGIFKQMKVDDMAYALRTLSEKNRQITRNIANQDTPFYKAKKLEFDEVMAAYFRDNNGTSPLYTPTDGQIRLNGESLLMNTQEKHIPMAPAPQGPAAHVRHQNNLSVRDDGNDVDLDYEMTELAGSSILYSAFSQMVGSKFSSLKEIIRTP
jgi:flagellar basal-body rod protein FlgB